MAKGCILFVIIAVLYTPFCTLLVLLSASLLDWRAAAAAAAALRPAPGAALCLNPHPAIPNLIPTVWCIHTIHGLKSMYATFVLF